MTVCNLINKYLKDNSTPGSWRRGYEYHQKGQVAEFEAGKTGIKAKVKGNFKSFYNVVEVLKILTQLIYIKKHLYL